MRHMTKDNHLPDTEQRQQLVDALSSSLNSYAAIQYNELDAEEAKRPCLDGKYMEARINWGNFVAGKSEQS